ncbi:TPA: hypothetical protein H1009_02590 [archaeon]|nr:hypothetical protein [Candidatus Naiadarchaeales archaeon SRR2090153.bin461]
MESKPSDQRSAVSNQLIAEGRKPIASQLSQNTKAASVILEQVFIALFGIILLVLVVVAFTSVRDKAIDHISGDQYATVANTVHSGLLLASRNMKISETGVVFLDIPDRIGGSSYRILVYNNASIMVQSISRSKNSSVQFFNVNANVFGNETATGGGRVYWEYNRSARSITLKAEERVISR